MKEGDAHCAPSAVFELRHLTFTMTMMMLLMLLLLPLLQGGEERGAQTAIFFLYLYNSTLRAAVLLKNEVDVRLGTFRSCVYDDDDGTA